MHLPDAQPETACPSEYMREVFAVKLSEDICSTYWETADPYKDTEPVCGDLADDLSDIAADLKKGITEYQAGRYGNAAFEWKFLFSHHWGQHAMNYLG